MCVCVCVCVYVFLNILWTSPVVSQVSVKKYCLIFISLYITNCFFLGALKILFFNFWDFNYDVLVWVPKVEKFLATITQRTFLSLYPSNSETRMMWMFIHLMLFHKFLDLSLHFKTVFSLLLSMRPLPSPWVHWSFPLVHIVCCQIPGLYFSVHLLYSLALWLLFVVDDVHIFFIAIIIGFMFAPLIDSMIHIYIVYMHTVTHTYVYELKYKWLKMC